MKCLQDFKFSKNFEKTLFIFLKKYGIQGLEQAIEIYENMNKIYICKNRASISKIYINDIYYMKIAEHNITIHTQDNTYQKYGTLNNELKLLSSYGFIKCAQDCIVSIEKIKTINHDSIILTNNNQIHMSRKYASQIILKFASYTLY